MATDEPKIVPVKLNEVGGEGSQATTEQRLHALETALANILRQSENVRGSIHFLNLSADPTKGNIGDLVVVGGKLKICTAANTFTIVGTQT